jgi:hypothetical protein
MKGCGRNGKMERAHTHQAAVGIDKPLLFGTSEQQHQVQITPLKPTARQFRYKPARNYRFLKLTMCQLSS